MTDPALEINVIPILESNYAYLVRDRCTDLVGVVDPGEAGPVAAALRERGWTLDMILLTHHHDDHVAGVEALRGEGVRVVGGAPDRHRLPPIDEALSPGDLWAFGSRPVEVLDVSGHTVGHIALWFKDDEAVFSGDCLFGMGCGRIFEGTALQMWESLARLVALPESTRVYCGHEMTEANARYCEHVAPDHGPTTARATEVRAARAAGRPTVPTTIGLELETNIFLRAADPSVAAAVGLAGADPAAVFAELRRRKDAF